MLNELLKIIRLLTRIVIKPKRAIKEVDIINYDYEVLQKLFYLILIVTTIFIGMFYIAGESKNGMQISLFTFNPWMIYLIYLMVLFVYYRLYKIVGKGMLVEFNVLKILLTPSLFICFLVLLIAIITYKFSPIISGMIEILINLWLTFQIYLISKYKLRQNDYVSIALSITHWTIVALLLIVSRWLSIVN